MSSSSWHSMNVHSAHVLPLHHCSFFCTVEPVLLAVRLEHVSRFPEFAALVARYFPFVFLLCRLLWGEEAWLLQGVLEGFLQFPVGVSLHVGFLAVCAAPTARSLSFPRRVDTTSTGWGRKGFRPGGRLLAFLALRAAPTARSLSFPNRVDTTSTGWGRWGFRPAWLRPWARALRHVGACLCPCPLYSSDAAGE